MPAPVPTVKLLRFRTYLRDTVGPKTPIEEALWTQEELADYLSTCGPVEPPHRKVEFPDERALAIALGARPTPGYGVHVVAIVQETGGIVGLQNHVYYTEIVPHGIEPQHLTYPHHVVTVRGLTGIVIFRKVTDQMGEMVRQLASAPASRGITSTPVTTMMVGEEHPPFTTLAVGEEHGPTFGCGEVAPTHLIGEHITMGNGGTGNGSFG